MGKLFIFTLLLSIACASGMLAAAAAAADLPPGVPALAVEVAGFGGTREIVAAAAGQPFTRALRVRVTQVPEHPYSIQTGAPTTAAIAKGDVLLLTFQMRAVETRAESGEGIVSAVFESAAAPNAKSLSARCGAGKEWKQFQLPFVSAASYDAGAARVAFHCGLEVQTLEIGGVSLVNYANAVKLADLPRTRFSYAGREADAAWRAAALGRIEKLRKADLTVTVLDAAGRPSPGASVRVRMTKQAFGFGSAVAAAGLLGDRPDDARYREEFKRLFNRAVFENDTKWPAWEAPGGPERVGRALDWLRDNHIDVRGHNLVWPAWRWLPKRLEALKTDPAALRQTVNDHVRSEAAALAGRLIQWDVLNEPFTNRDLQALLGDGAMIEWFKIARQADPKAVLFVNDYPILSSRSEPHLDAYERTIRALIDGGAPLGGIGFQCHYGAAPPRPAQIRAGLDRFAKFNLPIAATEFDIDTTDEELQADYVRDHTIALFSHPAVESIILWGFWEGRHWKPAAAMYRKDWSPKPAARAWEDLVRRQWWTDAQVTADEKGVAKLRGFLGDYELISGDSTLTASLPHEGAALTLRLK